MVTNNKRFAFLSLGIVLALLSATLAGCGGAGGTIAYSSGSLSSSASAEPADYLQLERAATTDAGYDDSADYEYGEYDEYDVEEAAAEESPDSAVEATPISTQRKIITTVDLRMESTEYDDCVRKIYSTIDEAEGYVESSDIVGGVNPREESPPDLTGVASLPGNLPIIPLGADYYGEEYRYRSGDRWMTLSIRVPQDNLADFLAKIETYGNVLTKSENAEDVTLRYVDMESRLKALKIEQDQLMGLLDQAATVEDMIALQERLSQIRYQIETYESQLRVLQNQVSYSTVNLTLSEVVVYTEKPVENPTIAQRISIGFSRTVEDIRNYWINQLVWLVSNSLYIAGLLLGLAAAFFIFRRVRRRMPPKPMTQPADNVTIQQLGETLSGESPDVEDSGKKKRPAEARPITGAAAPSGNGLTRVLSMLRACLAPLYTPPYHLLDKLLLYITGFQFLLLLCLFVFSWLDNRWFYGIINYFATLVLLVLSLLFQLSPAIALLAIIGLCARWAFARKHSGTQKLILTKPILFLLLFANVVLGLLVWNLWRLL